jgi:hypothetical protein
MAVLQEDLSRVCGCSRHNERFFALFQLGSNVVESAAILVEFAAAPYSPPPLNDEPGPATGHSDV